MATPLEETAEEEDEDGGGGVADEAEEGDGGPLVAGAVFYHPQDESGGDQHDDHVACELGADRQDKGGQSQGCDGDDCPTADLAHGRGEVRRFAEGAECCIRSQKNGDNEQSEQGKLGYGGTDGVHDTGQMIDPGYRFHRAQRMALFPNAPERDRQTNNEHHERQKNGHPKI